MIYLKEGKTPLNFAYEDEIAQEANSTYQLTFKYPVTNPMWEDLTEETLLLADDLHGEQEFIIFEVERHHGYITVYANQVATLLNNYSISELSVNNASGDRVMRSLVSSIIRNHKFTFFSDIAATHSINLKNVTVATALFKDKHSILGQWGGDLIRDKYDIKLLSNGGVEKEALFMYKKNLKSYQQKKSTKDLRTRIHFTKTINSQKEGEEDKVIAVTLDSPLINKYKNIYEGNLEVNDQDVVDEASLLTYAKQYYKTTLCDVIEENIEIDVIGKPDVPVRIFDTVTIFHESFNLDVKKKITKYTFSPMGKKLKTIGFGKIQQGLGTTLANMIDDVVAERVEESRVDAFKIQKNLAELLKKDRTAIEEKMKTLEEQSKAGVEVKKALFEKDGTVPPVTRTKILDAVEADIARLKTIITEAELIKAIQAHLNYAEIKTALIDKAFITQILSDETFRQQFEAGEVTTQNIFTKMRDSIQSSIKKEFITKDETKKLVNDLTIGADGVRQISQEETNKIFDLRKPELKGKDGKVPAFNQLIGTRFPSLDVVKPVGTTQLKLNKKDYNGQNSIEVLPNASNELQGFSVKVNLKGNAPSKQVMRIPIYVFSDSGNNAMISLGIAINGEYSLLFSIPLLEVPKGENKWIIVEKQTPFNNNNNQDTGFFDLSNFAFISTGNAHFKIAEPYIAISDVVTDKWLPAIEDMQSYSLTASARIEGSYLNENLMNCKVYLDVYSNGEIVRASTVETPLKIEIKKLVASGYTATGEVTLDSNGLVQNINIPNGTKDGQPIEVVFEVACGENKTVASARLNNTIDKQLLTETISKVKTFESTIDKFESKIGEINKQKFKMAYNIENLCSETQAEKKGNDLYFNTKRPLEVNKYYYILAYLKNVPDGRLARIYYAENNGDNKLITNGLNIWRVKYNSPQTRVNIFSQGSETTVKNVEIYEMPEVPFPEEDVLASFENNDISYFNLRFKRKIKPNEILKLTFSVKGRPTMDYSYYSENAVLSIRPLVEGENICIFSVKEETDLIQFSYRGNGISGQKSEFKCVKLTFDKGYKNEFNISDMESSIKQTKASIDLSVKKNDVISSINLTPEAIKIDSKRVDVTGLLTAYTGAIGGFLIGKNPNDNENWWITGQNQFRVGMSNGGGRWKQTALWVNWGYEWGNPSDEAWFVKENGEMYCYNKATFSGGLHTYNHRIDVHGQDVQGDASGSSKTTVIWWSQISRLRSAISDKRLKENIQPTKVKALDTLNKIEMVEFNWKKDGKFEKLGAIAQQVKSVEDSLVVNDMDDKQTFNDHLRINYYDTIPYLIKAVQELSEQVNTLTKRVEELERSKKDGI